jgi:hypothetical protein
MFIERTLRSKSGIHMKSCKLGGVWKGGSSSGTNFFFL